MRVLLVCHRFPPDAVAGVERYTQAVASRLAYLGDNVAVVTRRPTVPLDAISTIKEMLEDGTVIFRLVGGGVDRSDVFANGTALHERFLAIIEEARPDVIHVNHLVDLS